MNGQQQQDGSNHNWMAPSSGQSQQNNMGSMQNQGFQGQNAMQQRLSNFGMGNGNDAFGGGSQGGGLSQQELLMQQLRQQQQQQGQQDSMLMGHGSSSGGGGNSNMMNFPNLQQGDNSGMLGGQMGQGMGGMMGGSQSSNNNQESSSASAAANQKSFLDGNFAGGWQSNADLPDRRHIIFSILEVIKQMRPDTNKITQKYVFTVAFEFS